MKKFEDYDTTEVKEVSFKELSLGGHLFVIKNVKPFSYGGYDKISLEVDVDEEEYKNFYQDKFDSRPSNAKFWDDGATLTIFANPEQIKDEKKQKQAKSYTKGLITAIESYNNGYTFDWDENSLIGKTIGLNVSLKEYNGNDGVKTKRAISRFINSKNNFNPDYIPSVQTLEDGFVKYDEYINKEKKADDDLDKAFNEIIEVDDNFLD